MGTRGLPDIYTLSPWACSACALGAYIRQTTRTHVTTINIYIYIYIYISLLAQYYYNTAVRGLTDIYESIKSQASCVITFIFHFAKA